MENTTRNNYMTLEDQAEFLATQWMSVGQLEKAGELSCPFSGAMPERQDTALEI